ncbi:hypothetical protein [Hellea balneolensis]|uniref:hypothetical protein n=1 Tax=Hellea balneolensis TaxID=287478 RepID=UPI0012B9F0A4|nr:hypothetical protein [Hellea balneolensis]
MTRITLLLSAALMTSLAACTTVPEPVPEPVVVIPPEPIQTCAPVSVLTKVTIPAETKVQYAITMIDNPPYEPIENKVKRTIVVKPAQIIYVDTEGREVLDICDKDAIEIGETGPGIGETISEDAEG